MYKGSEEMARNKHPEKTVAQITKVAYQLFLEKGYEQTTIQDIVDRLGMSKGAIYHHFKSKDEIFEALWDFEFEEYNPDTKIIEDSSLNGLEKIRKILVQNLSNKSKMDLDAKAIPLLKNPRFVVKQIESIMFDCSDVLSSLIEEGNQDGSLSVENPKEAAELCSIMCNFWIYPLFFPSAKEQVIRRIAICKITTEAIGLPLLTDDMIHLLLNYYDSVFGVKNIEE